MAIHKYAVVTVPYYEVCLEGLTAREATKYCAAINSSARHIIAVPVDMELLPRWLLEIAEQMPRVARRHPEVPLAVEQRICQSCSNFHGQETPAPPAPQGFGLSQWLGCALVGAGASAEWILLALLPY
jgi:hypothetical protein